MKITKALFFELMYDFQSARWNEFELPKLSLRELLALAKLLGCPSCGSKETVIVRLLAQRELRFRLARFTGNPEELANSYKRESLRDIVQGGGYLAVRQQTRALGGAPELARSVPRARQSVFSPNAIAGQGSAATALFPLQSSVLTEELLTFYPYAARE
jgi:hypothetical protein